MARRPWGQLLLATSLVAACAAPTPSGPKSSPRPLGPQGLPSQPPSKPLPAGPALASTAPLGPIQAAPSSLPQALPQGALLGQVRGPSTLLQAAGIVANHGAGILSNNGSGIVSNHGSGIISNHGASWRLGALGAYRLASALDDAAASGAVVELVDAQGQALVGADGTALRAFTNAEGVYAFPVAPSGHARARVSLGEAGGALEAFVLPKVPRSDLNVVSTLVAGYVMGQYVATQSDPKGTLARLPAEVEAETRAKAEAAIASVGPLASLNAAAIGQAVGAMRQANPAFDAQMEAVKRLLIPAGQFNFGSGQKALDVPLPNVGPLAPGPQGSLYLAVGQKDILDFQQVWRHDPDGSLHLLVGGTAGAYGAIVGMTASPSGELYVGRNASYGQDAPPEGRGTRFSVHRVDKQGALSLVAEGDGELAALGWAGPLGLVIQSQKRAYDGPTKTWPVVAKELRSLPTGGSLSLVASWAKGVNRLYSWGPLNLALAPDGQGGLLALGTDENSLIPKLLLQRIALPGGAISSVEPPAGGEWYGLSAQGDALALNAQKELLRRPAGGGALVPVPYMAGAARSAIDPGRFMWGADDSVWYLKPRTGLMKASPSLVATHVAGRMDAAATDAAGQVVLSDPKDLTVGLDGELWVLDAGILKRLPSTGGAEEVVSFMGTSVAGLNEALAVRKLVGMNAQRELWALGTRPSDSSSGQGSHLLRRNREGQWSVPFTPPQGHTISAAALAPNGGLLMGHTSGPFGGQGGLSYLAADGVSTSAVPLAGRSLAFMSGLAWDPRRQAFVTQAYVNQLGYQWWSWAPGGAIQELPATPSWFKAISPAPFGPVGDAQGRLLWAESPTLVRRDAGSDGPGSILAGPGGSHFSGSGVDDGLRGVARLGFGPQGDLFLLDATAKQVKRIPADRL